MSLADGLSDSMLRRLEKEQEMLDSNPNPPGGHAHYPVLPPGAAPEEGAGAYPKKPAGAPPDYGTEGQWPPPSPSPQPQQQRPRPDRLNGGHNRPRSRVFPEGTEMDPHFEGHDNTFRQTCEWVVSLFLDTLLLFAELVVNIWLGLLLKDQGLTTHCWLVVLFVLLPSMVNCLVWTKLSQSYKQVGFCFMLAVLFMGVPSPMFVYIWHLYLAAFCNQVDSQRSKILANSMRVVQAFTSSLPLIVLNIFTLLSILWIEDEEGVQALDISLLQAHLQEVKIHGLAGVLSFLNILRAASVFNERKTFTLLFVMVGYPYLLFTTLCRVLAVAVIVCFLQLEWTILLFISLVVTNILLYYVCQKRVANKSGSSNGEVLLGASSQGSSGIELEDRNSLSSADLSACCCTGHFKCGQHQRRQNNELGSQPHLTLVADSQSSMGDFHSAWNTFPKTLAMSICSIVIPVGYTNDYRSHHPRIKGGLFILLNYFSNMLFIGMALGFTIVNQVPNTFHGVSFPQPSLKVEVPGSKVIVQAGGLDVALNLPKSKIDLGSMPSFSATLNTDSMDVLHAILIPVVLAVLTAPFVIMRAAMMELDCFVTRRKEVDPLTPAFGEWIGPGKRQVNHSLHRTVVTNAENKELKARLYATVCCSVCGMCVFTLLIVCTAAFVLMEFH